MVRVPDVSRPLFFSGTATTVRARGERRETIAPNIEQSSSGMANPRLFAQFYAALFAGPVSCTSSLII